MVEKKISKTKKKKVTQKKEISKKKKSKIKPSRKAFIKKTKKKKKIKTSYKNAHPEKKEKLAKKGRQTKWAPVWVVLKKFGPGKRIHPSATTRYRRSWRRTKLKITPRKLKRSHYG